MHHILCIVRLHLYFHLIDTCVRYTLHCTCLLPGAGVIAGAAIGVSLALVLILAVALIVAAVFLLHRRKTRPSMCVHMYMCGIYIYVCVLIVPFTHSPPVVQMLKLQHPGHLVQGKH